MKEISADGVAKQPLDCFSNNQHHIMMWMSREKHAKIFKKKYF